MSYLPSWQTMKTGASFLGGAAASAATYFSGSSDSTSDPDIPKPKFADVRNPFITLVQVAELGVLQGGHKILFIPYAIELQPDCLATRIKRTWYYWVDPDSRASGTLLEPIKKDLETCVRLWPPSQDFDIRKIVSAALEGIKALEEVYNKPGSTTSSFIENCKRILQQALVPKQQRPAQLTRLQEKMIRDVPQSDITFIASKFREITKKLDGKKPRESDPITLGINDEVVSIQNTVKQLIKKHKVTVIRNGCEANDQEI